ncbi:NAD(P)/FAD-dependent oxidoreductase [Halorientalis litorea]|jgi:NADH dehydrogenase|uniref:NAD(P)/FAD-dependent oxidoreductase n=1 Tax=Halorientalis litorea TaxID=2931977 RepID=UPI0027E2A007|nr:FAD-dependent oxidoreductase [Halorientalis litorea]
MRVAVFGAGYAGLTVARRVARRAPDVELVVVDEDPHHLVKHELHRLVRHPDLADALRVPLSDLLPSARVEQARVTDIDPEERVATLDCDGETSTLEYDAAAVCLGAATAFYDLPGVRENARPLQRVPDALGIREDALATPDGHAVVGGGGLSGVQVAGELAALAADRDLPLDVTLVERADRVASGFGDAFADAVAAELGARDVTVETGVAVDGSDEDTVTLADGRTLPADVFVWTGGIRGPDSLDGDRPTVGADLRVAEGTYVVGDAAAVVDADGREVPASAQTAVREARVAAANLLAEVTDAPTDGPATYRYENAGWVVSVGDGAVAQVEDVVLSGEPARLVKAAIVGGHLGSVGELGRAVDLVAEELGWPTVADLTGLPAAAVGTDPSTLSGLQSSFGTAAVGLSTVLLPGDTHDLTWLTRLLDRDFPGSPVASVLSIPHGRHADDRPE